MPTENYKAINNPVIGNPLAANTANNFGELDKAIAKQKNTALVVSGLKQLVTGLKGYLQDSNTVSIEEIAVDAKQTLGGTVEPLSETDTTSTEFAFVDAQLLAGVSFLESLLNKIDSK